MFKLAILALVLWGGHRTIVAGLADLHQNGWQISHLQPAWAALAALLYLLSQFPCGWFWHSVLVALGQPIALLQALRAYYIGHLGKYVPGKAMVVVLRAGLLGRTHVKTSLAVVAVFYETFTTMAVGAMVAAIILLSGHREQKWLIAGSLGLALVVGLPTLPPIFARVMRLLRLSPSGTESAPAFVHLSIGSLVAGWLAIAIGWFFAGASLWAVLRAIGVENVEFTSDVPLDTATVALAIGLGFVSMLPAGFGVREVVLLQLLAPRLEQLMPQQGQALALIAVIMLRLVWLAAEIALAAVLYPLARAAKPLDRK